MPLNRLVYSSICAMDGDPPERRNAVRKLAKSSAVTNGKTGLSGSLLYIDDCFLQVLEGGAGRIESVFENICCDFRHRELRLIDLSPINERQFADWGMALLSETEEGSPLVQEELVRIRELIGVNVLAAVDGMRDFLRLQ